MNGLVQIPISFGSDSKEFVFADPETFISFIIELGKKRKEGLLRMSKPFSLSRIKKFKYHALAVNDENEIVALHYSGRKKDGIYPITVVAKGKKEVAQLIRKEGW